VRILPSYLPARYRLARLYERHETDFAKAIAAYRELIRHAPDYSLARYRLGVALQRVGNHGESVAELRRARDTNPYHKGVHFHLAQAHLSLREMEDAERGFAEALELDCPDPELGRAYDAAATNALLAIYVAQGRWDSALAQCEEVVHRQPGDAASHSNVGTVYARTGDLDRAEFHFRKAIEIAPDSVSGHENLWVFLNEVGRTDAAADVYREILRLRGSSPMGGARGRPHA
jgi:tetratricopeptide (TPR) repeat protein